MTALTGQKIFITMKMHPEIYTELEFQSAQMNTYHQEVEELVKYSRPF